MRQLVPRFILNQYRLGRFSGSLDAACLFIDLSGFSKLADVLFGYEQPGAEILAEVMCAIFEPMVEAVYSQGGFVVGYSGDAFTAIFPEQQDRDSAIFRSLDVALRMQAYIRNHPQVETKFSRYPISVKIGIGYGEAKWNILESAKGKQATYYVHGSSVEGAVAAEESAGLGEILVDRSAYARLEAIIDGQKVNECYRLSNVRIELPMPSLFSEPSPTSDELSVFFPEMVTSSPTVGEFRQIVNLFIDIPIDLTDDSAVASFMDVVFKLQEQYGGYFLRPEIGDKGFNLLIFWGAPIAHETDIDRTLNFVLDLKARSGLSIRAGITYLTAYAGFIGASLREDYTAYGWGVNLAARFMKMSAPGEVWIDEAVARRAERHFEVKYRNNIEFKGFTRKQKVFTLIGRKEPVDLVFPGELLGRVQELKQLSEYVKPIFNGQFAGVLVVQGEAGIGKSRLVHSFQGSDVFRENPSHWVICQTDEILRQPLNPFKGWLLKRFSTSEAQSETTNLENFNTHLQALIEATPVSRLAAELERTRSVLAALLGIFQPDSLYEQLNAKERYENTFIALSTLLRAESLQSPLILFLEDVQWLDDDTRAFLPYFVRTILVETDVTYPIAILATRRPDGEQLQFDEVLDTQFLTLDRLSASDLSQLAKYVLGKPISASLLDLLERRTEGNPFFAEQILRYLSEKKLLIQNKDGLFDSDSRAERSLPMDVGAVLISRLDSLAQGVRDVAQTASILGREFEVPLLAKMLQGDADLAEKFAQAANAEIWFPLDQLRYIFRHALLRDAAYSMQLLTRQRELHTLAVSAMESLYANELDSHYGELAYHAERANLIEKALMYLPLAGKVAASVYQNRQAVNYFSRALMLLSSKNLHMQFDLYLSRANLYGLMGERTLQVQDLDVLEKLSRQLGRDALLALVWVMRADFAYATSNYPYAIEKAKQALNLAKSAGEEEVALDAYRVLSLALLRQGRLEEAMQHADEGLQIVHRMGKRLEEGKILNSMGLIALEQKEPANARAYFEQALSIARETSNRGLETKSLNNLGTSAGFIQGDYAAAREYYDQAYLIAKERGDRSLQSAALGNLGWAAGMQGDFGFARLYHEQALSLAREVGDLYHETYTLINLSAVAIHQKEVQDAIKYAQGANELSNRIGDRSGEAWSLLYLGYAYLLDKNTKLARDVFLASVSLREELDQRNLAMEPTAGLIQVALETNDLLTASTETEKILRHLENGGTLEGAEEPLRIYCACYQALKKLRDPRSEAILQEAVKLLDTQVSKLLDVEARQMFIQNVPCRRAIYESWQNLQRA